MADALIYCLIGLIIGWNLPQPRWAKWLQDKIVTSIKGWFNKE